MNAQTTQERLEELRGAIQAERISYGEIAELQSLAEHIDPSDVELLEWAGVDEFDHAAITRTEASVDALLRARQRGINHLSCTLEAWNEMDDAEKREAIEMALDRLERPW
jgi:Trk K+ transport system NAD-binding subunit